METTGSAVEPATPALGPQSRTRRPRLTAGVATVVLAAASVGYLLHRDGEYGPLQSGSFAGYLAPHSPVLTFQADGSSYINSTSPDATVPLLISLENDGSRAVTVDSAATNDVIAKVEWSTYVSAAGGPGTGIATPWHRFPVTVPAHGWMRLRVTVHRPAYCRSHPINTTAMTYINGGVDVTWHSTVHTHHTVTDGGLTLGIC